MIYTPRLIDAVHFAIEVHQQGVHPQHRKGKGDVPYITHPLTVGLILAEAGAREAVVIAGILHDVIEDCDPYGTVTKELLEERFGVDVAMLVDSVTEKNKKLDWHDRKEAALVELKEFTHDSLLLKSADVLSNNTELIRDYATAGDKTFLRFNAPKEQLIEHTQLVISALIEAWPENPLAEDLANCNSELESMKVNPE